MSEIEDTQMEGTYVVSFDDAKATNRALVGGKGANLARLAGAGLPVPEGFCVTTVVYKALIDDPSIQEAIHELAALDPTDMTAIADTGAALRTQIETRDIPAEIRNAIERALDENADGSEQTYAVRSSATAEDLPEASFAGQQETFLNVRRENVTDRVRACMASLFTDRAIAYRARNDISHEEVAIAVVVQRMVTSDVSGILFTADPQTGNRHITAIDAVSGLGEALVSGDVSGDTVWIDRRTGKILDYETGEQRIVVRSRSEGGTETVELTSSDRRNRLLTETQLHTLTDLGSEIESLFECPQDIEWCLSDGSIVIVQSRPITSLFPVPTPQPIDNRLHVYYSMGHAQAFAEAMPPMAMDIWISLINSTMAAMGLDPTTKWGVEAGGRIYIDTTPLLRVGFIRRRISESISAMSEADGAAFEALLSRHGEEFQTERTTWETIASLPRFATTHWRGARQTVTLTIWACRGLPSAFIGEPEPPEIEMNPWIEWGESIAAKTRAPDTVEGRTQAVFDLVDLFFEYPPIGSLYAALIAGGLLDELFPDANDDVNDVGRGFPDELVTRINLGLGDLADIARDHPAVAKAIREERPLSEIETVEGGTEFTNAFEEYLDEFGHRGTGELDISRPRWREDPSGLLLTIRANLTHAESGEHRERITQLGREANEAAKRLEQQANHGLLGPVRKRFVRQLIRTYRGYIQTREYPKQGLAYAFEAWHDVIQEAGEHLVRDGLLSQPEDVWFLRKDELFAALDGDPIDVDIAARHAEFERHKAMDAPPVITSDGEVPLPRVDRDDDLSDLPESALVGTGVSNGVVEGVAHVVRDPSTETIEPGEILIAPSSDPGWTPLFLNAAGMVVEVGTRMSHGAIVAREYGLPAVVSVPKATRRIETGQRVRIDGTQGTVEIMEDEHVAEYA